MTTMLQMTPTNQMKTKINIEKPARAFYLLDNLFYSIHIYVV